MDQTTDDGLEPRTADELTTDADDGRADPQTDAGLEAVVVRYGSGNDRCTLVPRYGPPEAMLTAWFSADLDSVVDLEEMR